MLGLFSFGKYCLKEVENIMWIIKELSLRNNWEVCNYYYIVLYSFN